MCVCLRVGFSCACVHCLCVWGCVGVCVWIGLLFAVCACVAVVSSIRDFFLATAFLLCYKDVVVNALGGGWTAHDSCAAHGRSAVVCETSCGMECDR